MILFILLLPQSPITLSQAERSPSSRARVADFFIDTHEVSIGRFKQFASSRSKPTAAEEAGGGYEYAAGWEQRLGWSWKTPFGVKASDLEPAVHITWAEARAFCQFAGGRLPTQAEWNQAAYNESREIPTDGYKKGIVYPFPVGASPAGMNTSGADPWPRHAEVGRTKRGVNGLFDMGANVWEWLADRRAEQALTAGGSWWYGPNKTQVNGAQYKPADFFAVYIGFRCVYDA